MVHKWQDITSDLYNKIKPLGGDIYSRVSRDYIRNKRIEDIWVEFDMNDFIYEDPFYGEQKSTAPFRMNFSLWDLLGDVRLGSVLQLEHKTFHGGSEAKIGSFSNSLHFTIPEVTFGKLSPEKTIAITLTYSLTNSDSYGMMDGSLKEHIQTSGSFSTVLKCKELLVRKPDSKNIDSLLKAIDKKHYDVSRMYEATDLYWSSQNNTSYYIPFASASKNSHSHTSNGTKNKKSWWSTFFGK